MARFWYENAIEYPIRKIVRNLRNMGVNTTSSCGHVLSIQCEFYDYDDLNAVYNTLVELDVKNYRVIVFDDIIDGHRRTYMEVQLPHNGVYYCEVMDNKDFDYFDINVAYLDNK